MKGTIKVLVCIVTFFASLWIFGLILNHKNVETTTDMSGASYPVISVRYAEKILNRMEGHVRRMDTAHMREGITPLSEGRALELVIDTFGCDIKSISYEVRSVDGERLVEDSEVKDFNEDDNRIVLTLVLKDLIEENKEYSLITVLGLENGKELYYYTRVIRAIEYDAASKITFASHFSEKTFEEDGLNTDLAVYLESDSSGDNSSFAHVNIHSSFEMVTWDNLPVKKEGETIVTLQELAKTTASVRLEYLVSIAQGKDVNYYAVTEYYRMRKGNERIYLLDYDRYMEQYFEEDKNAFFGDKIMIGVSDTEFPLVESEDGNQLAFVKCGSLYSCNIANSGCARIFSFYDENNNDWRTRNNKHDIRILSIDESGNISFMVYGYMNRGNHEGETGIMVCYYDGVANTVEETLFIPYNKSFEMLRSNVEKLSYLNRDGEFFLYLEGAIFSINLNTLEYEMIAEGMTDQTFQVSEDHTLVVRMKGTDVLNAKELELMNLSTGERSLVRVGENECVKPLGFMGIDLLYGIARKEDIREEASGEVTYPMHIVQICNKFGTLLKSYTQDNHYIVGYELSGNMITLKRVIKGMNGDFVETTPDTIMNNQEQPIGKNQIETVVTENRKSLVQIAMRSEMKSDKIKYMVPKEILYEGDRSISFDLPERKDRFFVYYQGKIAGAYTQPAEAIREAYQLSATVQDDYGNYVWIKGNLLTKNQIMKITGKRANEGDSTMEVCIETILEYAGYSVDAEALLDKGMNAVDILEENLPDKKILELKGCNLESVLYFVNKDIPVMAMANDRNAILIVGFNEYNVVWMNPANGKVYKVGRNDSEKYFEENGNNFITYMDEH